MFGIPKKYKSNKVRKYNLLINNESIGIELTKIFTIEEKIEALIKTNRINFRNGFFIRNQKGFNSFLIDFKIDLIFITSNGKIISLIPSFEKNKVSNYYNDSNTCIVLPENTIDYFSISKGDYIQIERKRTTK